MNKMIEARQYFIACEKKLKEVDVIPSYSESLTLLADKIDYENENQKLLIEQSKPKGEFHDSKSRRTEDTILVREFA